MNFSINNKTVCAGTGGIAFDPSRPTVILIHGAAMDHTVWALQSRYIAHHGYSVLALDLPGHGHSEGPVLSTIGEMSNWVESALAAVGISEAVLVGHSMGANIALEVAANNPSRIHKLVLAGAASPMQVNEKLLLQTREDPLVAVEKITSWAYGHRAHIGGTQTPGLWMLAGGRRLLQRNIEQELHNDFSACNNYTQGIESASKIKCPTLIIAGDDDRMTPARRAYSLQKAITNSRVEIIKDSGHMMMIECPDTTLALLFSFINSPDPPNQK